MGVNTLNLVKKKKNHLQTQSEHQIQGLKAGSFLLMIRNKAWTLATSLNAMYHNSFINMFLFQMH